MFQIIKRNQKLKDQVGIQKDLTSILGRRKGEDNKMKYIVVVVLLTFTLFIYACENTRQSIGLTTKPLSSGKKFEDSTKLNWKITWGKIRPKEDED